MRLLLITCLSLMIFAGCVKNVPPADLEKSKKEIVQTEKDFEAMALQKGIPQAFEFYAAEDGVINRHDSILQGKAAIKKHYTEWPYKNVILKWSPDFVDVSADGSMAYTYGKYNFSGMDTTGKEIKSIGYFHTVWKKQADGSWRFVWD